MKNKNYEKGRSGEDTAVEFLKKKKYNIIERNVKTPCGEIDIILRSKDLYIFVEVKSRRTDKFGLPQESVTHYKREKIRRSALHYLQTNDALDAKCRFDVIAIIELTGEITHIENAF